VPESPSGWSTDWAYEETDPQGSDFDYEVSGAHVTEPLQTSWGTYDDCIEYTRTLTIVNYLTPGNPEPPIVQVRTETYALGVGLIRYGITASDGSLTEGRLSNTNVVDRPGS
jgi:hypothetical protein